MTEKEVMVLLEYLSNSFPNQLDFPAGSEKQDQSMVSTWQDWLGAYELHEVKKAIKAAAMDNPDFVPTPAKITSRIDRANELSTEEAWGVARELAKKYQPQVNPNPLANSDIPDIIKKTVAAVGGIQALADRDPGDTYLMNAFYKRFQSIAEVKRARGQALPGKSKDYLPQGKEKLPEEVTNGVVEGLNEKQTN